MIPSLDSAPLRVFHESTNTLQSYSLPGFSGETIRAKKRRRVDSIEYTVDVSEPTPTRHITLPPRGRDRFAFPGRRQIPSSRVVHESFVSSNKTDTYRIHSCENATTYSTPFASMYSNGAKQGRNHLVATATQEGTIELLNMAPRGFCDPEPQRITIHAHNNAIFDLQWNIDDSQIVTSSGDHTSAIYDVVTQKRIGVLNAHTLTVKNTLWNPLNPSLLASASRDGDIHLWDLRQAPEPGLVYAPVYSIVQAHAEIQTKIHRAKNTTSLRSVTSLNYLPHNDNHIVSSGSANGVLKTWDIRTVLPAIASPSLRCKTGPLVPCTVSGDPTTIIMNAAGDHVPGAGRPRAIASVTLDQTGSVAWGLGRNGRIYTYRLDESVPEHATPSAVSPLMLAYTPNPLQSSSLRTDSFYPRLAMSSSGAYLAAGSSTGRVLLWDVSALLRIGASIRERQPVVLGGHAAEVSSVDWGFDSLLTSGDDCSIRVWRKDPAQARECRNEEARDGVQCGAWGYALFQP